MTAAPRHRCLDRTRPPRDLRDLSVADARSARPLDAAPLERLARERAVLVTVEEGAAGPLDRLRVRPMTLPDQFIDHDAPAGQVRTASLSAQHTADTALKALEAGAAGGTRGLA